MLKMTATVSLVIRKCIGRYQWRAGAVSEARRTAGRDRLLRSLVCAQHHAIRAMGARTGCRYDSLGLGHAHRTGGRIVQVVARHAA